MAGGGRLLLTNTFRKKFKLVPVLYLSMKEYTIENGSVVELPPIQASSLNREDYSQAHEYLPIPCHDVVIEHNGKLLLVVRDNFPAKDEYWVIGGRIQRGIPILESLRKKVKAECGLTIHQIDELFSARTFFRTDPFGHGKGTDTVQWAFFARGKGTLKLDHLHKKPTFIGIKEYTPAFRQKLHPYIRDLMDEGMKRLQKE